MMEYLMIDVLPKSRSFWEKMQAYSVLGPQPPVVS